MSHITSPVYALYVQLDMRSKWPRSLSHKSLSCPQFLAEYILYIILCTHSPQYKYDLYKVEKKETQSIIYSNLDTLC